MADWKVDSLKMYFTTFPIEHGDFLLPYYCKLVWAKYSDQTAGKWWFSKGIPNNAIVCTTQGPGLTALGGGDYDGDDVSVTDNASLVAFLEATTAAVATLDMDAARIKVQNSIEQEPEKLWQGPFRARDYIDHARFVPTRNVRGMATMFPEMAQAWKLPLCFAAMQD